MEEYTLFNSHGVMVNTTEPKEDDKKETERSVNIRKLSLETVAVDLVVIRLGGKQMTHSVFKQLPQIDFPTFPENIEEGMKVWGTVNYHPDKCSDDSKHLHFILEKNERLYRSVIYYYLFPYDEPYRKLYQLINEGAFFGSKNGDIQYGYPTEKKDFFESHISFLKNDKFRAIKAIEQIYSNNRKYHWIANHSQLFIAA